MDPWNGLMRQTSTAMVTIPLSLSFFYKTKKKPDMIDVNGKRFLSWVYVVVVILLFVVCCQGILLWQVVMREEPFVEVRPIFKLPMQIIMGNRPAITPRAAAGLPRPITELIEQCWSHDPNKRPTFHQIVPMLLQSGDCWCSADFFCPPTEDNGVAL